MAAQVNLHTASRKDFKVCVFCYKVESTVGDDDGEPICGDKQNSKASVDRFYALIQRYLEIPVKLNDGMIDVCNKASDGVRMDPCDVCTAVAASFNELYHEMKCVELKLQLQIRTLLGIMRDGGQVASRKQSLKLVLGVDGLRDLIKRRKNWARHCSRQALKLLPRVKLTDISTPNEREPVHETHVREASQFQLAAKWLISLAAVACLLTNNAIFYDAVANKHEQCAAGHLPDRTRKPLEDDNCDGSEGSEDMEDYVSRTSPSTSSMADITCENQKELFEMSETSLEHPDKLGHCVKRQVEDTDTSEQDGDNGDTFYTLADVSQTMKPVQKLEDGEEEEDSQEAKPVLTRTHESQPIPTNAVENISESVTAAWEPVKTTFSCTVCKGAKTFETYAGFLSHKRSRGHRSQSNQKSNGVHNEEFSHQQIGPVSNSSDPPTITSPAKGQTYKTKSGSLEKQQQSISSRMASEEGRNGELELCDGDNDEYHDAVGNLSPLSSSSSESDDDEPPNQERSVIDEQQVEEVDVAPRTKKPTSRVSVEHQVVNCDSVDGHVMKHDRSAMEHEVIHSESVPVPVDDYVAKTSKTSAILPRTSYNLRKRAALVLQKRDSSSDSDSAPDDNDEDEYKNNSSSDTQSSSDNGNEEDFVLALRIPVSSEKTPSSCLKYCTLDGCQFKTRQKGNFDTHQKLLHQLGRYSCQFCRIVQASPMLLCLHEVSEHSDKSASDFNCPRCPFATSFQTAYANHFATEHLKMTGLITTTPQFCSICKLEVKFPKRHFRLVHNTAGVEPDKVSICPEENCDASFISARGLLRHRREYHQVAELVKIDSMPATDTCKRKSHQTIANCRDIPNRSWTNNGLSRANLAALELVFKKNPSLEILRRIELSVKLKLTEKQIDSWWRYRRSRQSPEKLQTRQKTHTSGYSKRMYVCKSDECQFKTRKEENYNSHQVLHQLGTYPCSFCSKNQLSPMLLCIHEASEHSQHSTDPDSRPLPYRCPRCPYATSYQIAYANHFASVHLEITGLPVLNPQTCSTCQVEVKFPKRHFRLVHDTTGTDAEKIKTCPEENCEVVFINGRGLKKHRQEYHKIADESKDNHDEQPIGYLRKCGACPVSFTSATTYRQHKLLKHNLRCPIQSCKQNFLLRSELEGHSKLHGVFKCTKCSFQADYVPELLRHDIVCRNLKTSEGLLLSCPDCAFTTKGVLTLTCHRLETHLGLTLKIYKCTVCSSTFPTNERRKKHVSSQHGDTSFTNTSNCFKCSECPAYFTRRISLVSHKVRKHKIAELWKCKHCGAALANGTSLRNHVKSKHKDVISSATAVVCDQPNCGEKFHDMDDLLRHQTLQCASRDGFPRSKCKVCGKPCRGRGALRLHMKTHKAKVNPVIKCDICGIRYFHRRSFQQHMQYHKDPKEWKYSCDTCSRKFVTKSEQERHVKAEHSQPKECNRECEDCKEVFKTEKSYKLHRLKAHEIYRCPVKYCPLAFPEENDVESHKKLHGDFKCGKCRYKTQLAPAFFSHELDCHGDDMKAASRYKCPECGLVVKNKTALVDHRLERHVGGSRKIFKCQICSESFLSAETRKNHATEQHSEGREESERCDKCPAYFKDKSELGPHFFVCPERNESAERKYFCERCREQFKSEKEFETHSKFHGQWKCQFCPVVEEYAPDLALHEMETHARDKTSSTKRTLCSRCDWSCSGYTPNNISLAKHFVSKHLRLSCGVYKCDLCKRGFFTTMKRKNHHLRLHKPQANRVHKCDECLKFFSKRATLLFHQRRDHKALDVLKCKHCDKVLATRGALVNHMERLHTFESGKIGGKEFTCDQKGCGWGFDTADDLLYHSTYRCASKKLEALICQVCGKSCKGTGALKMHMRLHDPNRPTEWKCDLCGKTFKLKAQLQTHQEYHKGPEHWRFVCAVCSKKCATSDKLREHMRTHSKEKPFVCQVCGEKYAHNHNLRNHIQSKHKQVNVQVKKHVQRISVSRKGKTLGKNFCFMRDKDLEQDTTGSDSSDLECHNRFA